MIHYPLKCSLMIALNYYLPRALDYYIILFCILLDKNISLFYYRIFIIMKFDIIIINDFKTKQFSAKNINIYNKNNHGNS